jgi:hypothetical protein
MDSDDKITIKRYILIAVLSKLDGWEGGCSRLIPKVDLVKLAYFAAKAGVTTMVVLFENCIIYLSLNGGFLIDVTYTRDQV